MSSKNSKEGKHPGGRPPHFKTAEELEAKIEEYFGGGHRMMTLYTKDGVAFEVPDIGICDLCLFLGFADRRSFYDYEKRPEFSHVIKRARTMIEREYESGLKSAKPAGSIFALKQFGWRDRTDLTIVDDDDEGKRNEFFGIALGGNGHHGGNGKARGNGNGKPKPKTKSRI